MLAKDKSYAKKMFDQGIYMLHVVNFLSSYCVPFDDSGRIAAAVHIQRTQLQTIYHLNLTIKELNEKRKNIFNNTSLAG